MATFSQWYRNRNVHRVTWVCGTEIGLQQEVMDIHRKALRDVRTAVFYAGDDSEGPIWDYLLTAPGSPRLTVVCQAERLRSVQFMEHLLEPELDTSYALFFSTDKDFPQVPGEDERKILAPHLAVLRDDKQGALIRCCQPGNEEERAAIVAAWWPGAGRNVAAALLARCGDSMSVARMACCKARLAGLEPGYEFLADLIPEHAVSTYADLVTAGERAAACAAAALVAPGETGAVLGLLGAQLNQLAILAEAIRHSEDDFYDLARKLKLPAPVVRRFKPLTGGYGPSRVAHRQQVLALAESVWRSGAQGGILEAVAVRW